MDIKGFMDGPGKAIGFANTIYSSIKTAEYRENVLSDLSEIKDGIERIENQITELDNKLTYWAVWDAENNPLERIDTAYGLWERGITTDNKSEVCDDMNKAILQIYNVACGEVSGFSSPVIKYYIDATPSDSLEYSIAEGAFFYFNNMLMGQMLRAYSLLGAYGDEENFKIWKNLFTKGDEDDKNAVPYFEVMGTHCQSVMNELDESYKWMGKDNATISRIDFGDKTTGSVYIKMDYDIPAGSVVTGIEFDVIDGVFCLALHYGVLESNGYVSYTGRTTGEKDSPNKEKIGIKGNGENVRDLSLDTNKLTVPDGMVVISAALHEKTVTGEQPCRYVYPSLKCAKVVDGKIDYSTEESFDNNGEKVNLKEFPNSWQLWHSEPEEWMLPLSGVQYHNSDHKSRVLLRSNYHQFSFSE